MRLYLSRAEHADLVDLIHDELDGADDASPDYRLLLQHVLDKLTREGGRP